MTFQFFSGNIPVNVSNFDLSKAAYKLTLQQGETVTTPVPEQNLGSWNIGGSSFPYLILRDSSGTQVSPVATLTGTIGQNVSKFLLIGQGVPFNGTSRPAPDSGDVYTLEWTFIGTYSWDGQTYPFEVSTNSSSEMETAVNAVATSSLRVVEDLEGFVPDPVPTKPTSLRLFASNNLVVWVPVPGVETIPVPVPVTAEETLPLVDGIEIPGITKGINLFLRFAQGDL
jgi:hypothetical protein